MRAASSVAGRGELFSSRHPGQQDASSQKAGNKENAAHGMVKTGMPYIVMPPSQAMTCPVM